MPPPLSPLETEALVPPETISSNNNNNNNTNTSHSAPTGIWNKWRRLVAIILVGCFLLLLWDRIEIESAEDGGMIVTVKLPSLRGKVVVTGSSGEPLTKPPRMLLE